MENYQSKFQNARTVILSPELMELFPFLIFCNDKLVQSIYFCNNKFVWSISLNVFHAMYLVNLELDLK